VVEAGRVAEPAVRVDLPGLVDLPVDFRRVDRRVLVGRRRAVSEDALGIVWHQVVEGPGSHSRICK
jgi:hypothetical protein